MTSSPHVAIIGAGYAGLSAAVELTRAQVKVSVFEAATVLGGRAHVAYPDGRTISNGYHQLFGAYSETLRMLRFLGVSPKVLHTQQFGLLVPERLKLALSSLPPPLHLSVGMFAADGLNWRDSLAAMRLYWDLRRQGYALRQDVSVAQLLTDTGQTPILKELVWNPLCLLMLKTPAERASAQMFANVLRNTLFAGRSEAEWIMPRIDLSELLPVPATLYLSRQGNPVHTAAPIRDVQLEDGLFRLKGNSTENQLYSHVILATAPQQAAMLLTGLEALTLLREQINGIPTESMITTYLDYGPEVSLPDTIIHLPGPPIRWLFDTARLGSSTGLVACVSIADEPRTGLPDEELALETHHAIEKIVPRLPAPRWSHVVREKNAAISCTPGLVRPRTITPIRNLLLAGDYVESDYPSCIEGAVCSGLAAARQILRGLPVS